MDVNVIRLAVAARCIKHSHFCNGCVEKLFIATSGGLFGSDVQHRRFRLDSRKSGGNEKRMRREKWERVLFLDFSAV